LDDDPPPAARAVNIYMAPEADESGRLAAAWRVMEATIIALADNVNETGAQFYVAPLTDPTQAEPDPAKRKAAMAALGVRSLTYPSQRLRSAADKAGAGYIPVAQSVADKALASKMAFHRFDGEIINGHYNSAGHEAVAAAMADTLCP